MCKIGKECKDSSLNISFYLWAKFSGMFIHKILLVLFSFVLLGCKAQTSVKTPPIKTGAEDVSSYFTLLKGAKVGVVANHTSFIKKTHLVDSLLSLNVDVVKIFSPEHGFRGNQDAGENIADGKDVKTGLPIISLHGKHRKPSEDHLEGIEILVFDIQDVGVRFYTYISTMHYVMEAAAENNIQVIVFDRPNPNGDYVAGPVLDLKFQSFVGMHPIPVVHGMTVGELALMINKEGWLKDRVVCDLRVISCENYTHNTSYKLPVKPSPNLPNQKSVRLYPSLCLFEPTQVSIGRGTYFPFQVAGFPENDSALFSFIPVSIPGMSTKPKHENKICFGTDFRLLDSIPPFTISYLVDYYKNYPQKATFFTYTSFFNLLVGNDTLIRQLESGISAVEIENSWLEDLKHFKTIRKKYLLYPDFEE